MIGNRIKVLVTGGLGNLGAWITEQFARQDGYEVTVLASRDRDLLTGYAFEKIFCDITDAVALKDCLGGRTFDHVIHLASANDNFVENYADLSLKVNAGGTRNLLEAVTGIKPRKFIYMSTYHVYGKEEGVITESDPVNPLNDYAMTHYFAERYIRMTTERTGLPWIIFRLSNSYGCPLDKKSSKWYLLFNDLCRMAVQERRIELRTNGKPLRDFIAMGDVCEAVEKVMMKPGLVNELFNLGSGKSLTLLEVAWEIAAAYKFEFGTDLPIQVNKEDTNEYPTSLLFDTQKLKSKISFEPRTQLLEEARKIFRMLI